MMDSVAAYGLKCQDGFWCATYLRGVINDATDWIHGDTHTACAIEAATRNLAYVKSCGLADKPFWPYPSAGTYRDFYESEIKRFKGTIAADVDEERDAV